MTESFYDVLGVPEDASEEAITDAYRKRVKEVHPDVNDEPDAAEQFKKVSKAEEVLTDEQKRSRYDRLGHEAYMARESGNGNAGGGGGGTKASSGGRGFEDIRDAAAWASENTGRSGPTNRGADAGWRRREKRRHNGERGSWDIGGEDSWEVGDENGDRGGNGEDWEFGGQDWDLGDSDWDLGANWTDDRDGEEDERDWNTGSAGSNDTRQSDWGTRQRDEGSGTGPSRDPFAGTRRDSSSWASENTGGTGEVGTGSAAGVDAGAGNHGPDSRGRSAGARAETASTDGGKAAGAQQSYRRPNAGVHAAETQWGAEDSSYTVNDWTDQSGDRSPWFTWPDLQDDNLGLVVGTFFMIPLMLVTAVFPPFPLPINVVLGICTLLVTGYLITRPSLGVVVFAPWAVLLPLGLSLYGLPLESPIVMSAIIGTWVPLAYALLISFSLDQ
jgi:curved DNA-binding protein CbpA